MPELGWAGLGVVPEVDSSFYRKLERDVDPALARVGKSSGSKFGSLLGKAAVVTATGAIGAGFAAFKLGKDAVAEASTLNESLNAVKVSYGEVSDEVKALGEQSADSLGLSNSEFNGLAVQFSAFAKTIAGRKGDVVGTLDELTTRGSDFASVMNLEVNEALALFQSGLAGETEPLRKYGIDLSAAAVEAHALKVGITDGKDALTESEKVQARYSLLLQQTSQAQGDFSNTSDSLANRQRILSARFDDAQAKLGTALLPIMEDAAGFLLDKGIPAFEDFGDWFTEKGIPALESFGGFAKDDLFPILKDMAEFGGDAAKFVGDIVGFLNDLPSDAKIAALAAVLAGGAAVKLRGGKGGVLGTAGSALGLAKPVPVFVTNQGFGGTGTGTTGTGSKAGKIGKVLPIVGQGGSILAFTALASGAATIGIHGLGEKFAPEQTARGNFGTPQGGPGAILDFGDGESGGKFGSAFGAAFSKAFTAKVGAAATDAGFELLPKTLQSRFELLGVPETEGKLRHILNVYDIAAKDRKTTLELLGYEPMLDRIRRVNKELDWAARPREARISITKVYSAAGYETYGGLQEGGGGPVTRSRRRGGGGV